MTGFIPTNSQTYWPEEYLYTLPRTGVVSFRQLGLNVKILTAS